MGILSLNDKRAAGRLEVFMNQEKKRKIDAVKIIDKLASLNLASSSKDLNFFLTCLETIKVNKGSLKLLRKYAARKAKAIKPQKRPTKFPTQQNFHLTVTTLLTKKKFSKVLFLCLVLATGRRGVEIQRLSGANIIDKGNGVFLARLDWSKKSVKPSYFDINLQSVKDWLGEVVDLEIVNQKLRAACGKNLPLFKRNIHKNMNRDLVNFSLHSLRTVKSIFMLRQGCSEGEIMKQLGWQDQRMVTRYIRIDPDLLKRSQGMDEALKWVEKFEK